MRAKLAPPLAATSAETVWPSCPAAIGSCAIPWTRTSCRPAPSASNGWNLGPAKAVHNLQRRKRAIEVRGPFHPADLGTRPEAARGEAQTRARRAAQPESDPRDGHHRPVAQILDGPHADIDREKRFSRRRGVRFCVDHDHRGGGFSGATSSGGAGGTALSGTAISRIWIAAAKATARARCVQSSFRDAKARSPSH